MDIKTLNDITPFIPTTATEIIIRGRDATEVFFSMPKGWSPQPNLAHRIHPAPPGPYYKNGFNRWRISNA